VLLVESSSVLGLRAFHRQKLVLVWSAMRHFAAELQPGRLDGGLPHRPNGFAGAGARLDPEHGIRELRLMEPG
jgi:deoxyribodipyrimidine photolyase-related protein